MEEKRFQSKNVTSATIEAAFAKQLNRGHQIS
jgi:hypothetical protein